MSIFIMRKWGDLQLALNWVFEMLWPFVTHCNLAYFYEHESYLTSCMNYNRCNPPYVKLYTCAIHAIQLWLCKNSCCVILMQLVYNYNGNIMLTIFFVDPSKFDMWHYGDFWMKIIIFWNIDFHYVHFIWS
jgi:hypothetical protein